MSSRDVLAVSLAAHARPGLWGVMALPDSVLETLPVDTALLEDDAELYRCVAGFIFIRSEGWSTARHMLLAQAPRESPRPVIVANPDISAPYSGGHYSAEPGYWALGCPEATTPDKPSTTTSSELSGRRRSTVPVHAPNSEALPLHRNARVRLHSPHRSFPQRSLMSDEYGNRA